MDKKSKPVRKKTLTVVYKESIFVNMRYHVANQLLMLLGTFIGCLVLGCSNSEGLENDAVAFLDIEDDATPLSAELDYLPLNDSEYPYAGIPRIVIETENHRGIRDRETEIPAKLQIWGELAPESEIMELTIRGRGNTSWTDMPKKSYKIEFINKQSMLGMPKDKDWALIANYADKSLMRNYLMYHLAAELNAYYAPRCEFAELYLNNEYLGVYLLTETIKIAKKRVNIPQSQHSYIVEIDSKFKKTEQVVFSDILRAEKTFKIHSPHNASIASLDTFQNFIVSFENFLKNIQPDTTNNIDKWIDNEECVKYYWLQEFSKNSDTGIYNKFYTSVYFSFVDGEKIKMGPIWDFDLAFGNHPFDSINSTENWYIRKDWYHYLFKDKLYQSDVEKYWTEKHKFFESILDSIDSYKLKLSKPSQNNFKRWRILSTTSPYLQKQFYSYNDAVLDLKEWIRERLQWINSQYE